MIICWLIYIIQFIINSLNSISNMFIITLWSQQKTKIKLPPLLVPISQQVLTLQVWHLQQMALSHFQDYVSPFIKKQNLQLSAEDKGGQAMKGDYPIFLYCNFKEYVNNINCTLKSYDNAALLKRSYLLKYAAVVVDSKDMSERIVKQAEIQKLDKLLPKQGSVFINGKELQLLPKNIINEQIQFHRKWSALMMEKWPKFESPNNCVYIMI